MDVRGCVCAPESNKMDPEDSGSESSDFDWDDSSSDLSEEDSGAVRQHQKE